MKRNPFVFFVALIVKLYKFFLSPVLPHSCRFFPSCSEYTVEALHKYGISKGLWFSLKRIAKCHPLNAGGHDPIN